MVVTIGGANAQDTLRRVDGAVLIGKVTAIEKNQVQFTKAADSSVTYFISTADLASIHFASGRYPYPLASTPQLKGTAVYMPAIRLFRVDWILIFTWVYRTGSVILRGLPFNLVFTD
jgi:hypothetical protein